MADHARTNYAVAFHEQSNSIYIIGGYLNGGDESATVIRFSLDDYKFYRVRNMQNARSNHAAVVAGDFLYVIGGYGGKNLDTIEMLDLTTKRATWTTIFSNAFTPRNCPCVVALSPTQILILGGNGRGGLLSDVLLLEKGSHDQITIKKVADAPFKFRNGWNNQVQLERPNVILALVQREDKSRTLMRYDGKTFEVLGEDL